MTLPLKSVFTKHLPESSKSGYLGEFFNNFEKDMSSNGLQFGTKGGLSFYPHLTDVQLAARHPGAVRLPPPPSQLNLTRIVQYI